MSESTHIKQELSYLLSLPWINLVDSWKYHNVFIFSNVFLLALFTILGRSDQGKEFDLKKYCVPILWNKFVVWTGQIELRKKKVSFFIPGNNSLLCLRMDYTNFMVFIWKNKQSNNNNNKKDKKKEEGQCTYVSKKKKLLHVPQFQPSVYLYFFFNTVLYILWRSRFLCQQTWPPSDPVWGERHIHRCCGVSSQSIIFSYIDLQSRRIQHACIPVHLLYNPMHPCADPPP